ncbi:hypothetical protein Rsub_02436 [Raphidocelis subcapitata]|uniref:Uncharacterized protein n=1 Tax=Raphidocelis subcapitata TaxID=307507 RepID=A0A2V0NXL7_9CHLO|nr:hypothetical protein Rsub_02436 [Raphidocelis subcapitata]|eukprot:GBF90330.1 hypothetical protein Rsub_02436 [Raphidocelis subcapitata]
MAQLHGGAALRAASRAPAPAYAARVPSQRLAAPPPSALGGQRAESALHRSDAFAHQLTSRLRSHRQRLEHLVATGATSAADLRPVVTELRQIADMATAAGAWDRLRDQLHALERALAAASAPGSGASSSNGWQPAAGASSSDGDDAAAAAFAFGRQGVASSSGGGASTSGACVTVRTRGGATVELAVPDPDAAALGLQPAPAPRLAEGGKVIVCTGRKCCAQGARSTLAAAQRAAAGSGVEVAASKCMGKCGQGPCVRVRVAGREGSALTKGVDADTAVNLLRQQFGSTC